MTSVEIIAVMGACAPERASYSLQLPALVKCPLLPAKQLVRAEHPVIHAQKIATHAIENKPLIVEFPSASDPIDIIGELTQETSNYRLSALVCMVDASHLMEDLNRDDYVSAYHGTHEYLTARSVITARQIEHASMLILVNWQTLSADTLSFMMALVSHLSPTARLSLQREDGEIAPDRFDYSNRTQRPGWLHVLNNTFDPYMTHKSLTTLHYENYRPWHPQRLNELLQQRIGAEEFGKVIRSVGFTRFATRSSIVAQWDQVGQMISFAPIFEPLIADSELPIALGQDMCFLGHNLDHDGLIRAIDESVMSDTELLQGAESWLNFADPFQSWDPLPETNWSLNASVSRKHNQIVHTFCIFCRLTYGSAASLNDSASL